MRLFWWNRVPNVGDVFTKLWLEAKGCPVEWASLERAEMIGVGSLLGWFDVSRPGLIIWGSGRAGPRTGIIDLRPARVLALRGKDTLAGVRVAGEPVLGDPGLLVTDLVKRTDEGYEAIVPHWQDQYRMRRKYPDAVFVNVKGDPMLALRQIAGAGRVISSSLHGVIFADAYSIPRMWEWFTGVQGGGYKFHDYGTVVGHGRVGEWFTSDPALVRGVQSELRDVMREVVRARS